jgi:hypothetical protein
MKTKDQFNADLTAKLTAAGFTQAEQRVGALTSECKAALMMLKALGPRGILPFVALSSVFARTLSELSEVLDVSAERTVAASEIIAEACFAQAEAELSAMVGGVKLPLGGEAASQQSGGDCHDADCPVHGGGGLRVVGGLDMKPATDPKDIN